MAAKKATVADAMAKIDQLADVVGTLAQSVSGQQSDPATTDKAEAATPQAENIPAWQPVPQSTNPRRTFGVILTSNGVARVAFADADESGSPRRSEKSSVYGVRGVRALTNPEIDYLLSTSGQSALREAQESANTHNE